MALFGEIDDRYKGVRLERSASDQGAINVCDSHEGSDVVGLHAATILNTSRLCRGLVEKSRQESAQVVMYFSGLLRGGVETGPDGPDGFVGDGDPRETLPRAEG